MFSSSNKTCGSKCKLTRPKRNAENIDSMFGGWTVSYNSDDIPSNGTGDHEHYSYYRNRDKLKVYDKNGNEFIGCKKNSDICEEN